MPRALSYLLAIIAGLVVGLFVADFLWMNPAAAILGLYAAGVTLFLLSVDAVLSTDGVRGFYRDAGEGGRHLATILISAVASVGGCLVLTLVASSFARWLLGPLVLLPVIGEHIIQAGLLLLLPLAILAALWAILAGLEFWAARSPWWERLRTLIMDGQRGRIGLVLIAALISAVIFSIIRWEIQLLAVVSIGAGLFVLWLLLDRLLPRSRVWAVARQTVSEALHYKLVVAWVLVMLLLVFVLPPVITGDGVTLKSRVQSYLEVTLSLIGGGLGLLTVGLAAYTLPTEILQKQIFLLATKPIPRWQIFVGKWLGIGVLNAGLLLFSGAAVWGFTYYLKNEPASYTDRMSLEQEVLKVRQGSRLEEPPDLAARIDQEIRQLREQGELTEAQADEVRVNRLEMAKRNWRSIAPGGFQVYVFKNLEHVDREAYLFGVDGALAAGLDQGISEKLGRELEKHGLDFSAGGQSFPLQPGQSWGLTIGSGEYALRLENQRLNVYQPQFVHVRMKPDSASGADDVIYPIRWQAGDPSDANTLTMVREQEIPAKRVSEIVVPARAVGADNTLQLRVANLNHRDTMVFESPESLELLYGLGTFHWNLVRALCIVWCRLAFIAGMGLFLSTFLDFPVAFVCTLGLFLIPLLSGFLTEALGAAEIRPDGKDPIWGPLRLGYVLVPLGKAVVYALPDFSKYDAVGNIVSGRLVPIMWVLIAIRGLVLFWCGLLGVLGCTLLTKRELARDGT